MKTALFFTSMILLTYSANTKSVIKQKAPHIYKTCKKQFSDLNSKEKKAAIAAFINGECDYKGIKLYGKVQFVESFPDIKIEYVNAFPDIRVEFVNAFPEKCGMWEITESFPDFKVQVVKSFPDIKVEVVTAFPGVK